MIARLSPEPRSHRLAGARLAALALLPWLAMAPAHAEPDPAPAADSSLDAPFSPVSGDPPTPATASEPEPVFDPNFDPGFEPGFGSLDPVPGGFSPGTEAAPPGEPGLAPPDIDAYLDIAGLSGDIQVQGFDDMSAGFRLLAGFRLESVGADRWSIAPEVSYINLGSTSRDDVLEVQENGYTKITTDHVSMSLSAIAIGARIGWQRKGLAPYLRTGVHAYHLLLRTDTTYTYRPGSNPSPPAPSTLNDQATTGVGISYYGNLGITLPMSATSSLYAEYGLLGGIEGDAIPFGSLGVLLNF